MCAGVESECGSECVQGWRVSVCRCGECVQGWRVSVGVSVCRGGE